MRNKTLAAVALVAIALMTLPSAQAQKEFDCSEIVQADLAASNVAATNLCDVAAGCTTVFASAQTGTTISVANVVSWHLGLSFGTLSNSLAYVNCVV